MPENKIFLPCHSSVKWSSPGDFLKAQFIIFSCQKYVKKGYMEMRKWIYLVPLKSVLGRCISHYSEYVSNNRIWIRLCLLYYFFHFESIKFRSSRWQMSIKKEVFKNFAIFTGKHLCWSLFVIKLPAYKPANLLKETPTQVFFY